MGPPSYMRSVVDRNVVMRGIPVLGGDQRLFNFRNGTVLLDCSRISALKI